MKAMLVARKTLLEFIREPQLLGLELALPLFFMIITYIGYGTAPKLPTHNVLLLNQVPGAAGLIQILSTQRYIDNRPVYNLIPISDKASAEKQLKDQAATVLLEFGSDENGSLSVTVRGDATSSKFTQASTLLSPVISRYLDSQNGISEAVKIIQQPLAAQAAQSEFDAYLPGMMIFAILLLIPQTAMLVGREIRSGMILRLRLSQMTGWELLAGISLSQMVVAIVQVIIIFASALLLGFHNRGPLWVAVLAGLLLSFSAIGPGLIVACFSNDDSQALNIGSTITMLGVFLSGAWFPMTISPLFTLGKHEINIFDILPATHGMLALQRVMVGGAGLSEVSFRLVSMLVLSVIIFVIGVMVFNELKLKRTS